MDQAGEASPENPKEEFSTIKLYQDIVDRAHKEVEHVRSFYYLAAGLIVFIFTVATGAYVFLTYNNIREMKADLKAEVEDMKKKASQDYSTLTNELKTTVKSNSQDVERSVNTRIDAEFTKENIQGLVHKTAQERVDIVADKYIGQHITTKITPQLNAVKKSVNDLELNVDFNAAATAAHNDDRFAFEKLQKWSKDKNHPFRDKAQYHIHTIVSEKSVFDNVLTSSTPYPGLPNIDISKLTFVELKKQYYIDVLPWFRSSLLDHINTRNDFSKDDKLLFFVEVNRIDNSLNVMLRSAEIINAISGQHLDIYNSKLIQEWFNKTYHK